MTAPGDEAAGPEPPTITLHADCLMSKGGFSDGDLLWDYLNDYDLGHLQMDHTVLRLLVRRYLVPAMEEAGHTVEVYDIKTIHNPIRARMIDGIEIDDYRGEGNPTVDVSVKVTHEQVMAAARDALARAVDTTTSGEAGSAL